MVKKEVKKGRFLQNCAKMDESKFTGYIQSIYKVVKDTVKVR